MTTYLFANNAATTLAAPITSGATSLTLSSGAGAIFPNPGAGQAFSITMKDAATGELTEIMYCTSRTGDVCTIVRAQEGTTAQAWTTGDFAVNALTAGIASMFSQNVGTLGTMAAQDADAVAITGGSINVPTLEVGGVPVLANPFTTKGDILVDNGTAPVRLPVGTNGQVLTADSTQADGVAWETPAVPALTTKGDLLTNNGTTNVRLPVGTNGQALVADSTQADGIKWGTVLTNPMTTLGDVIIGGAGGAPARLAVGTAGQVLTVNASAPDGVDWETPAGGTLPLTTKGDLLVDTGGALARLPVGTDGQVLSADSTQTAGVKWEANTPTLPLTTKGDLLVDTGSGLARLPVGSDGQVLSASSAQTTGLLWEANTPTLPLTTKGDLLVDTGSGLARLGVGSDGQVLTADSTQTDGVKWTTPGSGGGSVWTFGVYASRPSASTLGSGNIYSATDTQENYISNGTSYTVIPGGGTEIGYAEITTPQTTTGTTPAAISGLTFTFVAGERPVIIEMDGIATQNTASAIGNFSMQINGSEVCSAPFSSPTNSTTVVLHREQRLSSLTPGTTYTYALYFSSAVGGGTTEAYATTTCTFKIRAVTT